MFIFGLNDHKKVIESMSWVIEPRFVEDVQTYDRARTAAIESSRGITFIADKYAIGTDIKYGKDGLVIVVTPDFMDHGKLLQCLGRGNRANGAYYGQLFQVGNPTDKGTTLNYYRKQDQEP